MRRGSTRVELAKKRARLNEFSRSKGRLAFNLVVGGELGREDILCDDFFAQRRYSSLDRRPGRLWIRGALIPAATECEPERPNRH